MRTRSLRRKILVGSSILFVALIAGMLALVNFGANRFVGEEIGADLEQGLAAVASAERERLERLDVTARLIASSPELKALLATDAATVNDALRDYRNTDLLIALDPAGRVIARTDTPQPAPIAEVRTRWIEPVLAGQPSSGILETETGFYHAALAPAAAGGSVFGFVLAGARIDDAFARRLRESSDNEIVLVADNVLGTTLEHDRLPWRARAAWESALGGARQTTVVIEAERFVAAATPLGREGGPRPLAVVLESRDRALMPYLRIQWWLLALGLAAAAVGIAASAVFARNITAPVAQLVEGTKAVAEGNFDYRLDIRTGDEIGDLAQSFNVMIQGLRERADMQKFVSQSTVQMIQASTERKAGERVVRTIFFSDMRGFTAMSESRRPEDVVRILNRSLSLQADKVKRFGGDVDKFVGDCVVALFEGPDMELDAIRCAVEIHQATDADNAAHPGDYPVRLGIGIATGEVILGSIGSEDRLDYTAIGSWVNLCSRLCALAGPREILLSESTYRSVQDLVRAERLEPVPVKGFSEPVPAYRMLIGREEAPAPAAPIPQGAE